MMLEDVRKIGIFEAATTMGWVSLLHKIELLVMMVVEIPTMGTEIIGMTYQK
jgi:hypothetical protein